MQRFKTTPWKTALGAALAVWLLLAEPFALAHQYDSADHANGQTCAMCVSAASFAAGNVAAPPLFELALTASSVEVAAAAVPLTAVPARRYARGPPAVSFMP